MARLGRFALVLLAASALILGGGGVASASAATASRGAPSAPRNNDSAHAVHLPMTLDCANMSAKARRYADAHKYCGGSGTPAAGVVSPDAVAYGNCGDSWIYVWNAGSDEMDVTYGYDSSMGPVAYRNLSVIWEGADDYGSWGDSNWWPSASSSYSAERTNIYAGLGEAWAQLNGRVTLWWGASCILLSPTDEEYITTI